MEYSKIIEVLKTTKIKDIDAEIAICVNAALSKNVSSNTFNLLCDFTYTVWSDVEKGYTQLIADIVVDLYQNCGYGYRTSHNKLLRKDLKERDYRKRNMVAVIFYDRYYG